MRGTPHLKKVSVLAACLLTAACQTPLRPMPLEQMKQSHFTRCVGDTFSVDTAAGPVSLRLATVTGKRDTNFDSFTLEFTGPANTPLGQETHAITHERLGTFALFLSPYLQKGEKIYYTAPFSRLRE